MPRRMERVPLGEEGPQLKEWEIIESEDSENKEKLPPLPFEYEKTDDPKKADYREWRVSPVVIGKEENQPKSDKEIIESIKRQHEAREWYTSGYWREKGLPLEQLDITIDNHPITIYNYNGERPLTEVHVTKAVSSLERVARSFPRILDKIRWILVENKQPPSLLGEENIYPTNGKAMEEKKAFYFTPRGMELTPHRIEKASNFEGTLVHELGHLIQDELEEEWSKEFGWEYCWEDEERWEIKQTESGQQRFFNKETGEIAPHGQYPLQPDQCVTGYARQNMAEDICESLVAYFFDPERLKEISPQKFAILERYNAGRDEIEVLMAKRREVELPEIKPQTITYYVEEE